MKWELAAVVAATNGMLVDPIHDAGPAREITSFAIDSRRLAPGACFVALVDSRDGHDYVGTAVVAGAVAALVEHPVAAVAVPQIVVADPLHALGRMGVAARARVANLPVVAVAGSVGKTTTKDLTVAALGATLRVQGSAGSLNNESGVPLTLLAVPDPPEVTDVIVLEFGERKPGDLAYIAEIAAPTSAIVTNVGLAHAEFLGGPEGAAREMQSVLDRLDASGTAVLNADDSSSNALHSAGSILRVGQRAAADVRVRDVRVDDQLRVRATLDTPWGSVALRLELRGHHHATNAAMAVAMAGASGVPLEAAVAGLESVVAADARMELVRTRRGIVVVNDAYNASPTSMSAALEAFAHLAVLGRRIAVLGEMRELGPRSVAEHERVGSLAASAGVQLLVTVGKRGESIAAGARRVAPDLAIVTVPDARAAEGVLQDVGPGDAVLLKASRAVGLDRIAAALIAREEDAS